MKQKRKNNFYISKHAHNHAVHVQTLDNRTEHHLNWLQNARFWRVLYTVLMWQKSKIIHVLIEKDTRQCRDFSVAPDQVSRLYLNIMIRSRVQDLYAI